VLNSKEVSSQIDMSNWKIPTQIIEEPNGKILIRFNSSNEQSLSSKSLENLELPRTSYSMPSRSTSYDYSKDNQVEDTQKIYYKAPIAEPIDEATSSIGSPTYSTMQSLSINVISKPLEINKDYLRQNFNSIENKVKREWFLSNFDLNAQVFIRQEWYSFMERHQVNVTFFNWRAMFASDHNLPDPFQVNEINTNINFAIKWTLLNGKIITSFTDSLQEIVLNIPEGNILTVPFKIGRTDLENSQVILSDVKKVYH